jgi:DNA-binding MurR/RpiR family transcriptional regulator
VVNTTDRREPTLAERVAASRDNLSRAEYAVARYMAENPQEVAFASAEELGQLTGTSDATVIRTVKALGYPGLPNLKRSLQASLREHFTPAGRLTRALDAVSDDPEQIFDAVVAEQISLLQAAQRTVRQGEFNKAVSIISNARYVLTCAVGVHGQLAKYFTTRMLRQGRYAHVIADSGFLVADALVPLAEGDAVILVCHEPAQPEDEAVIDHARSVGARIILITDTLGSALTDQVDAVLSAEIGPHGLSSITVTITILEALTLALAAAERERVSGAMRKLVAVRERLAEAVVTEATKKRGVVGRRGRGSRSVAPERG